MHRHILTAVAGIACAAVLVIPGAASAADSPDGPRPEVGPCKADVDKFKSKPTHKKSAQGSAQQAEERNGVKKSVDNRSKHADDRDPGGNNQALTGGLTIICR